MFTQGSGSAKPACVKFGILLLTALVPFFALFVLTSAVARAADLQDHPGDAAEAGLRLPGMASVASTVSRAGGTTLTVEIVSTPWATLDSNDASGSNGPVPRVFVVQAVVTNTGGLTATGVTVDLDFAEDAVSGWVLRGDEDPRRGISELADGEAYHAYWFAEYPPIFGDSHQYTVTVDADNAAAVSTSDNYYGGLGDGETVKTRSTVSAGNSGVTQDSAKAVVAGSTFTLATEYDLGDSPTEAVFSPVGNVGFDPSAYRLQRAKVRFFDDDGTEKGIVANRLYFDTLPSFPQNAEVTYTFLVLAPVDVQVCSYAAVGFVDTKPKYDQFYCRSDKGTVMPITGTLSMSITKRVSSPTIQQGQLLTYNISYSNSDSLTLSHVWIWDKVDTSLSSIITPSVSQDFLAEATASQVAWYLGDVAPGQSGTLTFSVSVDGGGQDIPNGTLLVNDAYLGINQAILPNRPVLTSTVSATVVGPVLNVAKSAFPDPVLPGRSITYTLDYFNGGLAAASNVVITDVVPLSTTYQACSRPASCGVSGDVVSWTIGTVPAATGGSVTLSVWVSDTLNTGDVILNGDYGIRADETDFISGTLVATLVTKSAGVFDGYAFQDDNANGRFDEGEARLDGVTVTLTVPSAGALVTETGVISNGYYRFRVELPGSVSVTAERPSGYFRTTAGTVYTDNAFGITQTINFGYAPITSTYGTIYGTVFEDADHDGIRDQGEKGLAGTTITSTEAVTSPVTTDQLGRYTLRYIVSDTVTITAATLRFYVSTTPDAIVTRAITGTSGYSPIDFGDFPGIRMAGQVFDDSDVDGVKDGAEGGLPDAIVAAGGYSVTTGSSGVYTLYVTVQGATEVLISESDPSGYVSTNAVPGANMSRQDSNTLRIENPISGTVYWGDFGDVLATDVITISGFVWNDNGAGGGGKANGEPDDKQPSGEVVALGGAVVQLGTGMTQTTGMDGVFLLYAQAGQVVTVTEVNPNGYISTNALPGSDASKKDVDTLVVAPLSPGSTSAGNRFGDVLFSGVAVITGTVFDDASENGVLDGGEEGLAGVTVTLVISGGGTIGVRTDSGGGYQFAVAPGTQVRLISTGPGGVFYPTTPQSVYLRPGAAEVYPRNDFGYSDDTDVAVTHGLVFDDVDGNGETGFGEMGLAGAVITLTSSGPPITVTTSGNGLISGTFSFSFTAVTTDPVIYGVHEKNPPGYRSTSPDDVVVVAKSGVPTYRVGFGDRADDEPGASFFGTVFEDRNVNGTRDPIEPGLGNVTVSITGPFAVAAPEPFVTNEWGQFTFLIDNAGTFTVTEQDLPDYVSTNAIPGDPAVTKVDNNTLRATAPIIPGRDLVDNDFGDVRASAVVTISGTVWDDSGAGGGVAADGARNGSEPGLAGAVVSLSSGLTQTTDPDGAFILYGPPNEVITVSEKNSSGFVSTGVVAGSGATRIDDDNLRVSGLISGSTSLNHFADALPADLVVVKSANPKAVVAGTILTYTLVYTNSGPAFAQGVYITDTLPDLVSYGGVESSVLGDPTEVGQQLIWSASELPVGAPGVIVFTVTVDSGANGTLTNTVVITSNTPEVASGDTRAAEGTLILAEADLALGKTGWPDPVTAGEQLTYTLTVTNNGPSDASGVIVSDTLPASVTFDGGASGPGCGEAGGLLTCTVGIVPDGDSAVVVVVVTVDPGAVGTLANVATAMAEQPDPDTENNRAAQNTDVESEADLALGKTGWPDPVVAGEQLTYTLTVTNNGPSDASGVIVSDTLPASVTFDAGASSPGCGEAGGLVTCTVGIVAAGDSAAVAIVVTVDPGAVGTLANVATVTAEQPDPDTENNRAAQNTDVTSEADLALGKTGWPDPVVAGEQLTYTLTVTNHGPSDASGVIVSDTLPASVTFDAGASSPGCGEAGGLVTCTVGIVADGDSAAVAIMVTVDPGAVGTLANVATVTAEQSDPEAEDNGAAQNTDVTSEADLAITKDSYPSPVAAGATLTYTLEYTNDGPSAAAEVVITDTLPDGVIFGGIALSSLADPIQSGQQLVWSVPLVPASGSGTVVFTVTVRVDATGQIENHVVIGSSTPDPDAGNNQQRETTGIGVPGLATIYGFVFSDANGNGTWDQGEGETGIPGVTVTLDGAYTATTNGEGLYFFLTDVAGAHTVVETDLDGYFSTIPNVVNLGVTLGESHRVDFGDALSTTVEFASVYGTVFEDQNVNGAWDGAEYALSGVTVTISGSAAPFLTNEWGQYTFRIDTPGTYTVTETDLPGYVSTQAIPGDTAVVRIDENTLLATVDRLETDVGNNLFGDVLATRVITVGGVVWNDNGAGGGGVSNGVRDGTEPGLAGARVDLSSGMGQTTGADGVFLLYAPPGEVITVTEANPAGFISSNAVPGNGASKLDNDTLVITDTLLAGESSVGNLFGDVASGQLAPCTCPPDGYEPDDGPDGATQLRMGYAYSQTHDFCDIDASDWFSFEVSANGTYTIATSSWGRRADTFLTLYDTDGQTVLAANDDYEGATDFSSSIVWVAPAVGTHYARVTNRAGLTGCETYFDLWIEQQTTSNVRIYLPLVMKNHAAAAEARSEASRFPTGIIEHLCPDAYEIDDTWQQARGIQPGEAQVHSFDSETEFYAADKDFVWFNAVSGVGVTFSVGPVTNTSTLLELYDDRGAALGVTGTTEVVWTPAVDGRFHLSASPLTTTFGCAETVGYRLLMQGPVAHEIYLPVVTRNW